MFKTTLKGHNITNPKRSKKNKEIYNRDKADCEKFYSEREQEILDAMKTLSRQTAYRRSKKLSTCLKLLKL